MEIKLVNKKIQEEEEKQFLELAVKVLSQVRSRKDRCQKDLMDFMEDEQKVIAMIKANDYQGLANFKPRAYYQIG